MQHKELFVLFEINKSKINYNMTLFSTENYKNDILLMLQFLRNPKIIYNQTEKSNFLIHLKIHELMGSNSHFFPLIERSV